MVRKHLTGVILESAKRESGIQYKNLLRKQYNNIIKEDNNPFLWNEVIVLDPRLRGDDALL